MFEDVLSNAPEELFCEWCLGFGVEPALADPTPCHKCKPTPALPYRGSSGWSGTDTSRERALRRDRGGKTKKAQDFILKRLSRDGTYGLTVKELRECELFGGHHGSASGALSNLHEARLIARLAERRDGCKVYVLPRYVQGRVTEPHKRWLKGVS